MASICVFCASRLGSDAAYRDAAREVGQRLGEKGLGLVFGGGANGLMGVLAESAWAAGSTVVAVVPESHSSREECSPHVTTMHRVASLQERISRMDSLSDGFLALPGGLGTTHEILSVLAEGQTRPRRKPLALFDIGGFFAPFTAQLKHAVSAGMATEDELRSLAIVKTEAQLISWLDAVPSEGT